MVRKAEKQDLEILANLAVQMWDSHSVSELIVEFSEIMEKGNSQFFLKYKNDIPIGFAQCQLRYDYVEGTDSSPVGYLEGIYVEEGYRKHGTARELLTACETCFMLSMIFASSRKIILLYFPISSTVRIFWHKSPISLRCSIRISTTLSSPG